ncbi:hypothetical protein ACIQMR_33440 [Streptomyces sp. NPDC091376]|uniref:hypothetical protein n=1 Tax=Streptomyces sp. NPDC091376 TaxID=3365994 RepID=UPI003818377A
MTVSPPAVFFAGVPVPWDGAGLWGAALAGVAAASDTARAASPVASFDAFFMRGPRVPWIGSLWMRARYGPGATVLWAGP